MPTFQNFRINSLLAKLSPSMRGKAVLAVFGLLIYALWMATYVSVTREELLREFHEMQGLHAAEQTLRELRVTAFHALLGAHDVEIAEDPLAAMSNFQIDFQLVESTFNQLAGKVSNSDTLDPRLRGYLDAAVVSIAAADAEGLQSDLRQLIAVVEQNGIDVRGSLESCTRSYQIQSDELNRVVFTLAICGVILFSFVVGLFFTNLADDLNLLKAKAQDIVRGQLGQPLPVGRQDEMGQLMAAVNQMQQDLIRHERDLALERQKGFHREKMAAIGTLAAGIAHEIGNPITAISGIAQEMCSIQGTPQCLAPGHACRPDLILEQTERIAKITREVSEFSAPRSVERELLDLNQLVRSSTSLLRYDKRFRHIELDLDLDDQLPAIVGVGDQLVQLIMNLLLNAADACENLRGCTPMVTVTTWRGESGREVGLSVTDNGKGMDNDTLDKATEAFFTTKPVGKGTGLGLAICASIIENHRGQLEISSAPDAGAHIQVFLPIDPTAKELAA
jgi:signal transduction histidine kinase